MMKNALLSCLLAKSSCSILLDLLFLSSYSFSLQLGVRGIAFSNIITESLNTTILATFLYQKLKTANKSKLSFKWMKTWLHLGFFSGLDSLVRNLTYMLVILRTMNLLSDAGLYWTTNTFIWSFILLPFNPLSEVLRVDISTTVLKENHVKKMR